MNCKLRDGKEYAEHTPRIVTIYSYADNTFEQYIECTRCGKRTPSIVEEHVKDVTEEYKQAFLADLNEA